MFEEMEDISQATEGGDFDYPRAVTGGLNAPFMSIYIPARHQESGDAKEVADKLIDMVEGFEGTRPTSSRWPGRSPMCGRTKRPV